MPGNFGFVDDTTFVIMEEPTSTWDFPIVIPGKANEGNTFLEIKLHLVKSLQDSKEAGVTVQQIVRCILLGVEKLWKLKEN